MAVTPLFMEVEEKEQSDTINKDQYQRRTRDDRQRVGNSREKEEEKGIRCEGRPPLHTHLTPTPTHFISNTPTDTNHLHAPPDWKINASKQRPKLPHLAFVLYNGEDEEFYDKIDLWENALKVGVSGVKEVPSAFIV